MFDWVMEILRCLSDLHFKLLQHSISEIANWICNISMVEFFNGVPQLNLAETESKNSSSGYVITSAKSTVFPVCVQRFTLLVFARCK